MNATSAYETAPPRIRRRQTLALMLLVITGVINYLDRATLAIASEFIRADLGLFARPDGSAAVGLLLKLCAMPASGRRAGRQDRAALAARDGAGGGVAGPGCGWARLDLRLVRGRTHRARHWGGAAIPRNGTSVTGSSRVRRGSNPAWKSNFPNYH